jgi:hypothetical protein
MIELLVLLSVGLVVGVIMFAVFMLHVLLALILAPFKLGILLLKGCFAAIVAVPAVAVAAALCLGLIAAVLCAGFFALLINALH